MGYKILIADDDQMNLLLMSKILESCNLHYKVIKVMDGAAAYDMCVKERPDLILMDWEMPVLTGIDAIRKIKTNKEVQDIPIIMETGLASSQNLQEALDSGAIDYIRKPIDKVELLARVKSALMLHDSIREIKNQKRRIEEQMDELNRLSLIVKQTDNSVIIANIDGEIEWANEAFHTVYGYTLEEFLEKYGTTIYETSSAKDINELIQSVFDLQKSITYVSQCKTKSNANLWLQTTITPLFDGNRIEKLVAIETDITLQKEAEITLTEKNIALKILTENLEKTNLIQEKQNQEILRQKQAIDEERKKSEALLLNILPHHVALQLKSIGYAKPRDYSRATVMFTDFQGFTKACETLSPDEIVSYLHTFFTEFDDIIVRHYIEKIKTIGDAYMCAGGLPLRNRSNPFDVVLAGLEIQKFVTDALKNKNIDIPQWNLRVGIHTGAVTAGVVGKIKFAYDIWGDSVNIAKRIESACDIGKVNISGATYEFIKDFFDCTFRGEIEIKNRGTILMYYVDGLKEIFTNDPFRIIPNDYFAEMLNTL